MTTIRTFFTNNYLKNKNLDLNKYLAVYFVITLAIGVAWGLFCLRQAYHDDEAIRNMIFLINFGLIAGGIPILSVWLPAYLVYVLPQSIAIFFVFIHLDYEDHYFIALTFFIFMTVMIASSFNVNTRRKHEIELTYHNDQLINELNDEIHVRQKVQTELEDNKRQLEKKVEERTRDLMVINSNLEKVIDKKEKAEQSLQYLAYHDELTGLPNRNLLIDRINHSIEAASRNKQQLGILFLDLDRFKAINDSLGHVIGDKLIIEVTKRLLATLRKEDTISRNGGDEFVVVIERMLNIDEAIGIGQKLIGILNRIFDIDSHRMHIGASIGISIYPNDGSSALELLRNADTAMFNAKKAGGNRLQFYDESMSNRLHERLLIESELHTALSENEFHLVYQPQVNCLTGETVGFEALLRWNNPNLGFVGPDQFVPILEETGLIHDVGKWVVKKVTNMLSSGLTGKAAIAINLSALQCGDVAFVEFIQQEITKANINPAKMEFEITESLLINDYEKTERFLNKLHSTGCPITLDDFGTGYTSMNYLTRLPIDCIKVDKSFIRNIDSNPTLENIVKAIVNLSTSLGIKNVFEGVETTAELNIIQKLKGLIIQGYLYSKPLNENEINNWLTREDGVNIQYLEQVSKTS
ncbi:MAG: EAL domain-containing protein [Gammaproteobacteria bacterium]|nr:EAL domain-containing protein [Gammaproteobacteria bacterium]